MTKKSSFLLSVRKRSSHLIVWLYWSLGFWILYLSATTVLGIVLEASLFSDPYFSELFGIHFLFLEAVCSFIPFFLLGTLAYFAFSVDTVTVLPAWRRVAKYGFYLVSFVLVLIVCSEWSHYIYVERFYGFDSAYFYLSSPWHLLEHAFLFSPQGSVVLLCCMLAIWVGGILLLPKLFRLGRVRWKSTVVMLTGVLCLYAAIFYSPFPVLSIRETAEGKLWLRGDTSVRVSTIRDYLEELMQNRVAPFMALILPPLRQENIFSESKLNTFQVEFNDRVRLGSYRDQVVDTRGGMGSRKNVILILVESLRADQLKGGGSEREVMPTLESLAMESVYFRRHYSAASHSNYADIAAVSGLYPLRGFGIHVYPKSVTYPRSRVYDLLSEIGYETAIISSQNENWGGMLNYLESDSLDFVYHADDTLAGQQRLGREISLNGGKCFDSDTIDVALDWMEDREKPFFAYINLQSSHYPYYYPMGLKRPFGVEMDVSDLNFLKLPAELIPAIRDRYADSLYHVDQQIKRLIDGLKASGRWEDTILIVTGDTGQAFGEHGFTGHASYLYDEVLRTPLLIYSPDHIAETIDGLSQHVDIAPTILSLLDLPSYGGFQGVSLMDGRREWAPLVCQSPALKQLGIVTNESKLLYNLDTKTYEYYNLNDDPEEFNNRYNASSIECEQLSLLLNDWAFEQIKYYKEQVSHQHLFAPSFPLSLSSDNN